MVDKKILFVDDSKISLMLVVKVLEKEGYNVVGESSPVKALDTVLKFKPDLLLVDMSMPKMNGFELAKKIKELNSKIKVVLYSWTHKENLSNAVDSSYVDVLLDKKYDERELLETINKLLK
jgi:CheY-like chemotaxis protein